MANIKISDLPLIDNLPQISGSVFPIVRNNVTYKMDWEQLETTITASNALNGFPYTGSALITGSLRITGSLDTTGAATFSSDSLELVGTTPMINIKAGASVNGRGITFDYNGAFDAGSLINYGATGETRLSGGASGTSGYFLGFHTDGTEKMRITSAGITQLKPATGDLALEVFYGATSTGAMTGDASNFIIGGQTSKGLVFCTNNLGQEKMRITVGGNVLIGTRTDVNGRLQVLGADNAGDVMVWKWKLFYRSKFPPCGDCDEWDEGAKQQQLL